MGLNLLRSFLGFTKGLRWREASKCKRLIKKLQNGLLIQKNRRNAITKFLHDDIAQLLQLGHRQAALEKVEQLYKDQLILSAYDQVGKFCDCIRANLGHISTNNSNLSGEVCEAVASLIFAASRCGELPELHSVRILFTRLLGHNFERANVELHPGNRVNSQIKHNLNTKSVAEDVKIQLLNEIESEDKHNFQPQFKVLAKPSHNHKGIDLQPQASNFEEMLQRIGSKYFLKDCKNMINYWSNISNYSTDKAVPTLNFAKANSAIGIDQDIIDISKREDLKEKKKMMNSSIHVHPKLPDYDELVAKFTYLKKHSNTSSVF